MKRVCFVSTYKAECGIATYTHALGKALTEAGAQVSVLCEATPESVIPSKDDLQYFRIWNRGTFNAEQFTKAILNSKHRPDIVHFQHEFGLFPNSNEFLNALEILAEQIAVVVTLHTVLPPPNKHRFYSTLERLCTVVVHTAGAAAQLHHASCTSKVIPHGVRVEKSADLTLAHYFLCPGFISPGKGHEEIIEAFAHYTRHAPHATLHIVGKCRDYLYAQTLDQTITKFGLEGRVFVKDQYLNDSDLRNAIAGARCIVLGSGKTSPYSASGQLAMALGLGKPILAKNVPIYNNTPVGLYNSPQELALFMGNCEAFWNEELVAIAEARSWPKIAQKHLELYNDIS